MTPERRIRAWRTHSAEKVHDTILDDEKYDVQQSDDPLVGTNVTDNIHMAIQ